MAKDQPAPGALERIRVFVNTLDIEEGTDQLDSPAGATEWLQGQGLWTANRELRGAERDRLLSVREALRLLLLANNTGDAITPATLAELNEHSRQAALGLSFGPEGAELISACEGIDAAIGSILAIVGGAMADGSWPRLKACPAEDCMWVFYDHSRNRSGTWCLMGECGNRAKARSFRERRRSANR